MHLSTVDGLINRGKLISGWAYIGNNIFVGKWMGLYPDGAPNRGNEALMWDFTVNTRLVTYLLGNIICYLCNVF